jgi:cytochrome c553
MIIDKRLILASAMLVALGATTRAFAADLAAGKAKAVEVCQACHGADGNSPTADFPKLGGQYPDYLAKALRDYKSGQRKNPIMAGFAQPLSSQDIDNLAAYYASQPATVSTIATHRP